MEQNRYATKKKGKTEVYPFWNMADIKNVVEWFENNNEWDGYLITMLELLLGRRIGDATWEDSVLRKSIIKLCDVLVDGEYIDEQRDITLPWRGSNNQRVIDVQKSLKQGKVVLYCD